MKTNFTELNTQETQSTTVEKKMKLSANAQTMVFKIFTKSVYSNPIGTIVREITSNCFDSHVEAKVDSPVIIRLTEDKITNTKYINFIDYGVGMSPDRMENVFGVYFETTKSCDNEQIGGFGIGGKTPLAYKRSTGFGEGEYDNSYNIITYFDGVRYEYLIYEGKDCPIFNLVSETPTTERNGTEVRVPVLDKDLGNFKREMVRQLYYFENVIFENLVDDEESMTGTEETLTNEFTIVRGKNFLFRGSEYENKMHVCLGRVAYPINYETLGLDYSLYKFPVALRLEVGDIDVIISREALDYNETTIKMLKKKLEAAKKEIIEMLVKQYDDIQTLEDYFKVKTRFGILEMPNGESFSIGDVVKMKDVNFSNFKYNFMKMPNDKQLFRFFFENKLYGKKLRRRSSWRYDDGTEDNGFEGSYETLMQRNANLYYNEGEFVRKIVKQAWLKQLHTTYFVLSKNDIVDRMNFKLISDLFNVQDDIIMIDKTTGTAGTAILDKDGNVQPTLFMQELLALQYEYYEILTRQCKDYNTVIVPQDFIDGRKANAKKLSAEFKNTSIPVKVVGGRRGKRRVKLSALFELNVPIFYGIKDDEYNLKNAKHLFEILYGNNLVITEYDTYSDKFHMGGKKGILFIEICKGNVKYMKFCKNAKPISRFNSTYLHRKEKAILEYFQAKNFTEKFYQLQELYRIPQFAKVSPAWADKIAKIQKFVDKTAIGEERDWNYYKTTLMTHYPIDKVVISKEQQEFISTIDEVKEMQDLNKDILRFVKMPYSLDDESDAPKEFWDMLKRILVY